ncbi:hypothetical protein Ciccas_012249 [Cichlidogyrus casuarinus]|uniref:Uncharacterized protein n=1 Tax=Cichlidogyrus casuarinus TaxID=1844966 RepID=A0ABD2PS05_9PLAT
MPSKKKRKAKDSKEITATGASEKISSLEFELEPELLEESRSKTYEPSSNKCVLRSILKNQSSVDHVDLNSSGVQHVHTVIAKDEVEILHQKSTNHVDYNFKTDPGFDTSEESPWSSEFMDQESTDSVENEELQAKKHAHNRRAECHSQTDSSDAQMKLQSQVDELNVEKEKISKDFKFCSDKLNCVKGQYSLLEDRYTRLKTREEDVSRTCQALQQELNLLVPKLKNAEKDKDSIYTQFKVG